MGVTGRNWAQLGAMGALVVTGRERLRLERRSIRSNAAIHAGLGGVDFLLSGRSRTDPNTSVGGRKDPPIAIGTESPTNRVLLPKVPQSCVQERKSPNRVSRTESPPIVCPGAKVPNRVSRSKSPTNRVSKTESP